MSEFKGKSWREISIYPSFAYLIIPVPGDQFLAKCNCCKGNLTNLSNLRMQALKSHYKGAKHLKVIATICNVKTII